MNKTRQLSELGQSLWLDNISRDLLNSGQLRAYIDQFSISGLTSNPSIFEQAIKGGSAYDAAILAKARGGSGGEALLFELVLEDLRQAADLFRPLHERSGGLDGWVSLEVSPLLADDTAGTIETAAQLFARAERKNLLIKIPGTAAGIPAIEASIFAGVPVNVTLLFSPEHYLAAAEAYLRGIERRVAAGLDPAVHSVASIFVSRWDSAIKERTPAPLHNRLGIAIAQRSYILYRQLLASQRWQTLANAGAQPQRLLWASTGTKDPAAPNTLYVEALAAPDTINTLPEKTLRAFADHGAVKTLLTADASTAAAAATTLVEFTRAGIDLKALAAELQRDGTASFARSWRDLLACIEKKSSGLNAAGSTNLTPTGTPNQTPTDPSQS